MAIVIGDLLIPCIIIFIGNITISCLIVKRRRNHHVQYGYTNNQGDLESKLVTTMVAVSITFVILSSPITIYYTIGPYLYGDDFAHNFDNPFYLIGDCIQYTNSGINFYLYVCFTNSFREELVKITNEMKCRRCTEESVRETSPVARQSSVLQTVSVALNWAEAAVHACGMLWCKNLIRVHSQASLNTGCRVNLFNPIELWSIAMPCGGK